MRQLRLLIGNKIVYFSLQEVRLYWAEKLSNVCTVVSLVSTKGRKVEHLRGDNSIYTRRFKIWTKMISVKHKTQQWDNIYQITITKMSIIVLSENLRKWLKVQNG